MKLAEKQYMDSFTEELEAFKDRVRKRAQQRIEEALAEHEEVGSVTTRPRRVDSF